MRVNSIKAIYRQEYKTYKLTGLWGDALGEPETNGAWLIWGEEKNGKTTLALMLANYMTSVADVLYVSGEEGISKNFKEACQRAGIDHTSTLRVLGYTSLDELDVLLGKRRAPKVVVLDNITVYNDDLKYGKFEKLLKDHDDVLFIWIAHEDKKQPYTSSGKLCSRYAKVKIHVAGMVAVVGGRCPGGVLTIDDKKAALYWGAEVAEVSK
jgi:hypothetical protein